MITPHSHLIQGIWQPRQVYHRQRRSKCQAWQGPLLVLPCSPQEGVPKAGRWPDEPPTRPLCVCVCVHVRACVYVGLAKTVYYTVHIRCIWQENTVLVYGNIRFWPTLRICMYVRACVRACVCVSVYACVRTAIYWISSSASAPSLVIIICTCTCMRACCVCVCRAGPPKTNPLCVCRWPTSTPKTFEQDVLGVPLGGPQTSLNA